MSTNKVKLEALLKLVNAAAQEAIAEYEKVGGDVPCIDSVEPHPLDDGTDQVALKCAVRTLEGACAQLCATLAPPSHTLVNLVQAHEFACLCVAIRENITDILADHPDGLHVNELSKIAEIEPRKLARILRLLATRGFYREVQADTFANNRLSLILHKFNPLRNVIGIHEAVARGKLMLYETLKDPRTACSDDPADAPMMYAFNKEGNMGTFFDLMKQDEARREDYNSAMKGLNSIIGSLATLTGFPFDKYSAIVDVGGGIGAASLPLAKANKNVKVTVQDLPEVLDQARRAWETDFPEALEENRVQFVELDFLTQPPVKGKDVYYLRNIIHDWPDEEAILILQNIRSALAPHSRVLIHDQVLRGLTRTTSDTATFGTSVAPEPLLPNFGVGSICSYQLDLTMWIVHNAKERTLQEFLKLATAVGLKLVKVWDLGDACVLEFSAV